MAGESVAPTAGGGPSAPATTRYVLAGTILLVAAAALAYAFPDLDVFDALTDSQRIHAPGEAVVGLEEPGPYTLYLPIGTTRSVGPVTVSNTHRPVDLSFTVIAESTQEDLPVRGLGANVTLTLGDEQFRGVGEFDLPAAGPVRVLGTYPEGGAGPAVELLIGPSLEGWGILAFILRCFLCLGILGAAGIALLVILLLPRRRQKRAREALSDPL